MNRNEIWAPILQATDVTDEVLEIARDAADFHPETIDWHDVWDRMEKSELADGRRVDMGGSTNSPAMRKIKKLINAERGA